MEFLAQYVIKIITSFEMKSYRCGNNHELIKMTLLLLMHILFSKNLQGQDYGLLKETGKRLEEII